MRPFAGDEHGSAATEFALLAPVLALILGGAIEVGNLVQTSQVLRNAAREGARYAAVSDPNAALDALNYLNDTFGSRTDVTLPAAGSITVSSGTIGPNGVPSVTVTVPLQVRVGMPVIQNILGTTVSFSSSATLPLLQ